MFARFLLCGLFLIAVDAADKINIPLAIPPIIKDLIPKSTIDELNKLTADQHALLQSAFKKHGSNATALATDLRRNNPELAIKIHELMTEFESRVQKLPAEGKSFVTKVIEILQNIVNEKDLQKASSEIVQQWQTLMKSTKSTIEQQFPTVPKVLDSDKFKKFATEKHR
ncbi:Fatty-acid and retinol-binding protein 4 [Aphelenchoides besseyi]|nr:Fatty-acid and retinol-binding protein 4 [Aphelenchoides besseyi]KAI6193836.1 Fatty-acid and retinol-binding protein 4 [Aphelenchoides besseyi]